MLCFPDAHPRRVSDGGRDGRSRGPAPASAWRPPCARRRPIRNPMPAGILGADGRVRLRRADDQRPGGARDQRPPGRRGARRRCCSGPWRAVIVMAVVLAVQALLFQDGGITALGANIARHGRRRRRSPGSPSPRCRRGGRPVPAGTSSAACSARSRPRWSPPCSRRCGSGCPACTRSCPIVQLMLVSHVAIGLLEAALTGAVLATVVRWRPDLRSRASSGAAAPPRRASPSPEACSASRSPSRRSSRPSRRRCRTGSITPPSGSGFAGRAAASWPAPFAGLRRAVPVIARRSPRPPRASSARSLAAAVAWGVSRGVQAGRS